MFERSAAMLVGGAILAVVILSVADPRVGSNPITYVILAALIIVGLVAKTPTPASLHGTRIFAMKDAAGKNELGDRERKFLIFHILTLLEKKQSIEVKELASELNVGIYEFIGIIQLLGKHGALDVIYPPMQDFPLIRKGDPETSRKYRMGIYKELAKDKMPGESRMDEFAREVSEYLENIRRREPG